MKSLYTYTDDEQSAPSGSRANVGVEIVDILQGSNSKKAHLFASSLLLLFSMSHLADLIVGSVTHAAINPVFPFLQDKALLLFAIVLELAVSWICWRYRGWAVTNIVILGFVGCICWYRWAFFYAGGTQCNCAGILGKLFHMSKSLEKRIPVIVLILLTLTTRQWLLSNFTNLARRVLGPSVVLLTLLLVADGNAAQVLEVCGEYSAAAYNPRTGEMYMPPMDGGCRSDATFTALLSDSWVRISATNKDDPRWWAEFFSDGTNAYRLYPYDSRVVLSNYFKPGMSAVGTASPGPALISETRDQIGMSIAWLTYGLRPGQMATNRAGAIELPLPWFSARTEMFAFGYRWDITPDETGRFVDHITITYDQSLELSDEQELLRREFCYPTADLPHRAGLNRLRVRRQTPTGTVAGRYECTHVDADQWPTCTDGVTA